MKTELLKRMSEMDTQQLYAAMYTDHLTGCLNRKALDYELEKEPGAVAIIDLDSLKFVNDNAGHKAGDVLIAELVNELNQHFDEVYRTGGDEFVVTGKSSDSLFLKLNVVQGLFPKFSFGTADNMIEADQKLNNDKKYREAEGCRAARGKCPKWYKTFVAELKRAAA